MRDLMDPFTYTGKAFKLASEVSRTIRFIQSNNLLRERQYFMINRFERAMLVE